MYLHELGELEKTLFILSIAAILALVAWYVKRKSISEEDEPNLMFEKIDKLEKIIDLQNERIGELEKRCGITRDQVTL